jgi:hypothetical protein
MVKKKDVYTSGKSDSRSSHNIPKHLKLYSESNHNQVTEQQFAHKHPKQYKALQIYTYAYESYSGKKPTQPLNKFKRVIALNKPFISKDVEAARIKENNSSQSDLILPLSKFSKDEYYSFAQSQAIAHEVAHTYEKSSHQTQKDLDIESQELKKKKPDFKKLRALQHELKAEQSDQAYANYLNEIAFQKKHRQELQKISGVKFKKDRGVKRWEPSEELIQYQKSRHSKK